MTKTKQLLLLCTLLLWAVGASAQGPWNIGKPATGTEPTNAITAILAGETLTISGTGEMMDYEYASSPWYSQRTSIKTIIVESGVTSIGEWAFYSCTNLTSVTLPEGLASIKERAFYYCTSLAAIELPESLINIATQAFLNCKISAINIPKNLANIEEGAFAGCPYLETITVDAANEHYCAVNNVLFDSNKTTLITYPAAKTDASYTIPATVTTIALSAFSDCENLEAITIPEGVTTIGYSAFADCSNLETIVIPSSITSIERGAFEGTAWLDNQSGAVHAGNILYRYRETTPDEYTVTVKNATVAIADRAFGMCFGLTAITLPPSITSIGEWAFESCTSLTAITLRNPNPEAIAVGDNAFFDTDLSLCTLYVPAGAVAAYSTSDWGNLGFGSIEQMPLATMSTAKATVNLGVRWTGNGTLTANGAPLTNDDYTNDIPVIDGNVSLIATGDVQLIALDCGFNQLTELDVTACTELVELDCNNNQLTELDVTACTKLMFLLANNQNITITQAAPAIDGTLSINNPISYNGNEVTTITDATAENGKIVWNGLTGESGTATCSFATSLPEGVDGTVFSGTLTQAWSLPPVTLATMSTAKATVSLYVIWSGNGTLTANGTALTNDDWTNEIPVIDGNVSLIATGNVQLTFLDCCNNQLTELDVTACTELTVLGCRANQLTELNVTACTELVELYCIDNQLTELDVTACTKLEYLECYNNQLTKLDVTACTELVELSAHNQNITITQAAPAINGTLSINNPISYNGNEVTTVEDATAENGKIVWNDLTGTSGTATCTFATSLPEGVTGNAFSGTLTQAWALPPVTLATMSTAKATVNLGVRWTGNGTLTANGAPLTNDDYTNDIPVIDGNVSLIAIGDVQLAVLSCVDNQLTELDVTACTELVELYCFNNQLTELDVTACTELVYLDCFNNQLTELDVTACTKLMFLSADNQNITITQAATAIDGTLSIDNPIRYNGSEVTTVEDATAENGTLVWNDLTGTSGTATCTFATSLPEGVIGSVFSGTLTQAWAALPQVTLATMSTAKATVNLHVAWTGNGTLTANGTALTNNDWTDNIPVNDGKVNLVATGDVELTRLICSDNQLTKLDVTACTELEWLSCGNNQLTELDVTACTKLTELYCDSNQLTELNVTACTELMSLVCSNNQLESLDVSNLEQLMVLVCGWNSLTSLAVNDNLQMLFADYNQLSLENLYTLSSKAGGYSDLSPMMPGLAEFMAEMGYPEGASLILSPQLIDELPVGVGEVFTLPESLSINETETGIEVFVGFSEPADPSSYTIDTENGTISFNEEEIYIVRFSNRAIISDDENNTPIVAHFYMVIPINFTVSEIDAEYLYTGSPIEPPVEVKDGETLLVENTDYTLAYSNNIEMGTATITITGMGAYSGVRTLTFQIVDKIESGIPTISAETAIVVAYYNIAGQRLMRAPEQGVYIVVYNNGTAKKMIK